MKRASKVNINTAKFWDEQYEGAVDTSYSIFLNILVANNVVPGASVVDLGCGNGAFLRSLSEYRPECALYGVDFSIEGVEKTRAKVDKAMVMVSDVVKTPFPSDGFDFVTSIEVLEHLDEPELMVKEMARLVMPGGYALLTTPWRDHAPSHEHVWEFELEDVKGMFDKYFSEVYLMPMASARGVWEEGPEGNVTWPILPGEPDTIFVRARK